MRSEEVTPHSRARKQELGQFLTPSYVANLMASMFAPVTGRVRLLDAGAGAGALTAAFVARACETGSGVSSIDATLYEVDPTILPSLSATMLECEHSCAQAGVKFVYTIHESDFIDGMSASLAGDLFGSPPPTFDIAIANPPYRKISADSHERRALRSIGIETSNLYTGFVALIQRLLAPGGQLVAITPRSFCNGPYFRPFREDFLNHMELRRLHVFDSRQAAFRSESVLQENVIVHAAKGRSQPEDIVVSSSSGAVDDAITTATVSFAEIVHRNDPEKFIHIPSTASHATAKDALNNLRSSLAALGVTVSTGRVVDFRLKTALRKVPELDTVPLIYPCHFNGGTVHWPKLEARKPNAIVDNAETRPWLVPIGMYLLTKRFTSKEERRRVVACVVDPSDIAGDWIGFENHVNYFHARGRGLPRDLAVGLYAFLSSTIVDQYFRRFSGHTQVNATDLRTLAYPDRETLEAMGREMTALAIPQDEIDALVDKHLHATS